MNSSGAATGSSRGRATRSAPMTGRGRAGRCPSRPGRGDGGEMEMGGRGEMERGDFCKKIEMERGVASGATAANAQLTAQSNGMACKGWKIKTSGTEGMSYFSMAYKG